MGFIMPEVALRRIIDNGIKQLRQDKAAFTDLFATFEQDELAADYGPDYVEQIWGWFTSTKIPVVQAWSLNAQRIPSVSIHLANETEDEAKAAIGDIGDVMDNGDETGTGVFTVMVDIGIHANKGGDHVLWMYYILSYILFRHKSMAFRFGMKLSTFSASDYSKNAQNMGENVWTRWIRFRCTTENFWNMTPDAEPVDAVNTVPVINQPQATDVATSLDVDITTVDTTANQGLIASRIGDINGDEDLAI
jgi:hypothetical protein